MIDAAPTVALISDRTCTATSNVARLAQQRLQASPYVALRSVKCQFHEGVLVLTGVVPTFYTKQIAQEALHTLDHVEVIDNRLVVSSSGRTDFSWKERMDACTQSKRIADHLDR